MITAVIQNGRQTAAIELPQDWCSLQYWLAQMDIVMKTGTHPFVSPLKLFFKWGISFSDTPYTVAEHGARKVCYVSRVKIMQAIASRFPQVKKPKTEANSGGTNLTEPQPKAPIQIRTD